MTFDVIKKNYERKLWNEKMVETAVKKGIITAEQFKYITENEYVD